MQIHNINEPDLNFANIQWEEVQRPKGARSPIIHGPHEIWARYGNPKSPNSNHLKIIMGTGCLIHLDVTPNTDDRIHLLQNPNDPYSYLLMKSANGYKVTESHRKNTFEINPVLSREGTVKFPFQRIQSYLKLNKTIILVFPKG